MCAQGKKFGERLTPEVFPLLPQCDVAFGNRSSGVLVAPTSGLCCGLGDITSFPELSWKGLLQECVCHECVVL